MAKAPTSDVIKLADVRLSFAKISKPEAFEQGQTPKFGATFLLDPSKPEHKALIGQVQGAAKKLIEEVSLKIPDFEVGHCFGYADKHPKKSKYDGYAGMFYVCASNEIRPTLCNRRTDPVAEGDAQFPYSGCYVNGTITLWLQNNKWGKKINANLRAVQFVRDGEAFGRAPVSAEDEFEPLEGVESGTTAGDDWG